MISNNGERVGVKRKNKSACAECGNKDRFKSQCPIWKSKKKNWANDNPAPNPKPQTKGGEANGQKGKEGKGGAEAVKFTFLELGEYGPVIEEIPENEVNVASRLTNLANALGVGDWEKELRRRLF